MAAANVSRRLARLSQSLGAFDRVVVRVVGESIVDALEEQAARDTGGDRRMSGMGKRGGALGVDTRPLSNPVGVRITPKRRQSGMWAIVSSGRSGFTVQAKARRKRQKGTGRSASRARAMRIGDGGGWAVGPWHVGGTRGKGTWSKGVEAGLDGAHDKVLAEFRRVVRDG